MKNVKIHVLTNDPAMQPHAGFVQKEATDSVQLIAGLIPVADVDIIIMHSPVNVAFGLTSGQCQSSNRVIVALRTNHKQFKKRLRVELQRTLAHMLYRIARTQKIGYVKTLADDIIEAGLAIHFEIGVAGHTRAPYWTSIKKETLAKLTARAKKEFYSTDFVDDDWFYGSKIRRIPRFAGFCLGYNLIKNYLDTNPGVTASSLVEKKSKTFLVPGY